MAVTALTQITGAYLVVDTSAANAAVAVKASSAVLYELELDNTANGAASYFKICNLAAGSVSVGTTVPDWVIMVPASVSRTIVMPSGITFGTALSYFATTAGGTAGSTSPSSAFAIKLIYV